MRVLGALDCGGLPVVRHSHELLQLSELHKVAKVVFLLLDYLQDFVSFGHKRAVGPLRFIIFKLR